MMLNLACLEKADNLTVYIDEVSLKLILMVKVILLGFQFLAIFHIRLYLGDTRIYYIDACNGKAYRYTDQIRCLSIRLVKWMNEKPRVLQNIIYKI